MIKKIFFLWVLGYSFLANAQEESQAPKKGLDFAFSPGIIQQRNTFLEANLFIGRIVTDTGEGMSMPNVGDLGFRFGIESDCNRTFAPKIGCEIAATACTIRL